MIAENWALVPPASSDPCPANSMLLISRVTRSLQFDADLAPMDFSRRVTRLGE
jgi:hypothetical protein